MFFIFHEYWNFAYVSSRICINGNVKHGWLENPVFLAILVYQRVPCVFVDPNFIFLDHGRRGGDAIIISPPAAFCKPS